MQIYHSILDMIGHTPILELSQLDTGPCRLFIKLEQSNPAGSIKDRIALYMIEQAEQRGDLKPGGTIVEGTAGNTGLGLALAAQQKGYRLLVVMPDKMGKEKVMHLKAMGAEVIMTRSDVGKGHPEYYLDLAASITEKLDNAFYIQQFANADNPHCHETTTGPELWQQMAGNIDAFVYGMGTSGTMNGVGRFLKQQNPAIQLVLADPKGSILADLVNTGQHQAAGKWLVEGIGEDYVPTISDLSLIDHAYSISDNDSFQAARDLLVKTGVFAGSSTGTHLHAALQFCRAQTKPLNVVTVACDSGNKYLSKFFDDEWLWQHGFLQREKFGDLRDLIARPHQQHATTKLSPKEPIATALKHMQNFSISQVPVLDEDRLVGLVRDVDLLTHQQQYAGHYNTPVADIMQTDVLCLQLSASLSQLRQTLSQVNAVAIIDEAKQFYGLISRIDLIHFDKREAAYDH